MKQPEACFALKCVHALLQDHDHMFVKTRLMQGRLSVDF